MNNSLETLKKRNEKRAHWKKTIDPNSFPRFILRVCKDCGLKKECKWTSTFTQTGTPEYRTQCKDCYLVCISKQRKVRRKIITAQVLKKKYKIKQKCIEYLGGKCEKCNYSKCIRSLTFHHTDPKTKVNDVCKLFDRKWEKLQAELDKCQLLCFNCHMEEEERLYNEHKRYGGE